MDHKLKLRSSALSLAAVFTLAACGSSGGSASSSLPAGTLALMPITVEYSDRDWSGDYDENIQNITLSSEDVTISEAGTYILTGTLTDGQVIVSAGDKDKVQLVLDGASITCADGPAIVVQNADKVFLTLADGSQNTLSDGGAYSDTAQNACVYAASDLTINGSGSLTVNGNYNHGVYSKDDLTITGGTIAVTAVNDGLKGKDAVQIAGGTITIAAGGDGIQSSNANDAAKGYVSIDGGVITVTADGDGVQAETRLQVTDGNLNLTTGGGSANGAQHTGGMPGGGQRPEMGGAPPEGMEPGERAEMPEGGSFPPPDGRGMQPTSTESALRQTADAGSTASDDTSAEEAVSAKGLKGVGSLLVTGGSITADCADDALHTNGSMGVAGGTFTLQTGDDGMHADGALVISGGTIDVQKSYEGLEGQSITISGGSITVTASDDGLNAAGGSDASGQNGRQDAFAADENAFITISGGNITVSADGDGVDSNGDLTVSGGALYVNGPTSSGDGALDYNGTAAVTGGTVIAAGASGMAEGFGDTSTQYSFLVNLPASVAGGTALSIADGSGKTLATYTPSKAYQSVCVSLPALKKGETYTITAGEQSTTVTLDSVAVNEGGGMGGHGGGRPDKMNGGGPGRQQPSPGSTAPAS